MWALDLLDMKMRTHFFWRIYKGGQLLSLTHQILKFSVSPLVIHIETALQKENGY